MANVTIEITDTEMKCLEFVANDVTTWVHNSAITRAQAAKKVIIDRLVAHCNANSIALAVGEDAQITQAYDLGVVDTSANIQAESDARAIADAE